MTTDTVSYQKILIQQPHSVLIVCTQRIGDVLLSTPIARSIKLHWPNCAIDYLVLPGTQGVLEGNADVRHVLLNEPRAGLSVKWGQLMGLRNRYDLSLATIPSDRARLHAWMAAPVQAGFVHASESQGALKRIMLKHALAFDDHDTHTVNMNLQLAQVLNIPPCAQVVPPRSGKPLPASVGQLIKTGASYAVLHPSPKFPYKMWTTEGWQKLGQWLLAQRLRVVLTGGPDPVETAYVQEIAQGIGVGCMDLSGQLSLGQSTLVLSNASIYIGPDTAMTHIAASTGIPTLALFGPTNPVKWSPWPSPQTLVKSPWKRKGSQQQGNVWLIQGPGECVPCHLEGCDRHEQSRSNCLHNITLTSITRICQNILACSTPDRVQ